MGLLEPEIAIEFLEASDDSCSHEWDADDLIPIGDIFNRAISRQGFLLIAAVFLLAGALVKLAKLVSGNISALFGRKGR